MSQPQGDGCRWIALGCLALLAFALLFDTLVAPGARVLGDPTHDLAVHFLWWREFGFAELAKGNLALWNPHIFSGAPFFGNTQSALLYPINWLFLVLPLALATNWSIALNAWLLGAFMYLWAGRRGLHPLAAFLCGALLMLCAPYFLHVPAGHLNIVSAIAWIPLQFLAIDAWLASRRRLWCLIGMLAVAMQLLSGQPQYVYLTALMAAGYALLRLLERRDDRVAAALGVLSIYAGGALLAAVQLFAGMQATTETIRSRALPFQFAASFNFPPENLITLLAPGFFGDVANQPYWGRWYLWEACGFIGVTGLALAGYGMARAAVTGKRALLAVAALALVLALGDSTPLFRLLFDWLPLFDRFRGAGKFIFITALVLVLLAGYGLDRMLRERSVPLRAIGAGALAAVTLCGAALAIRSVDWSVVTAAIAATGQGYTDPRSVPASQAFASLGLLLAGLTLSAAVCLAFWTRRQPRAVFLLAALAIGEVFAFARMQRTTFDSTQVVIPELRRFLAERPGDYRILNLWNPNTAMSMRALEVWGYDPGVARRYAEFMAWSAGGDPDLATNYVTFRQFHPLLAMLRVQYVVLVENNVMTIHPGAVPPLRRLELVGSHHVHAQRADIFRAMGQQSFDPRNEVILEREPDPMPVRAGTQGSARVVREGTDFVEIDADVASPSILLVTDAWTPGWRATPLPGSSQTRYEIMPANYVLRGVALERGRHRLRLEYAPGAFPLGAVVSAMAWAAWLLAAWLLWRRERAVARA
jgi:hypothetical protein